MKLLILYTKNTEEVFNRKSAIGSYINCLGGVLNSDNIEVYLNGLPYNVSNKNVDSIQSISKSKFGFIKKLIPNVVKRFIRDRNHIKSLSNFKNKLVASEQKYDAILEFYNLGSDVGLTISKTQNIPLFITYDGPIIEEYEFFNDVKPFGLTEILRKENESLKHASKIVVYSNPMKTFIKNSIGYDSTIFIHQNVDFTRFDVLKEEKYFDDTCINICFIGSFLKWHQVDLLVNAFQRLIEKGLVVKLFLVGDGQERKSIEHIVNKLPKEIKSNIKFTGFLDGTELFDLKKEMHIGVMPGSNWYGAPNKIFEYGAMKMAVLAPNTPTILDLFKPTEIDFFEWGNGADLEVKLEKLIRNKTKLSKKGHVLNEKISLKHTPENTSEFYQSILE